MSRNRLHEGIGKKVSSVEQQRIENTYTMHQVLWLTGMTDSQYAQFMFDTGVSWIMAYTGEGDGELLRSLMSQPAIWQWWKNEWMRRDEQYLPSLYETYQTYKVETAARYRALHQETFVMWTPPYTLLERAYAEAIGKMHHQHQQAN